MIELSAALAITSLCAWDFGRRYVNASLGKRERQDWQALSQRCDEQERVLEALAKDWRKQLDAVQDQVRQVDHKVNGKLTGTPKPLGYNR